MATHPIAYNTHCGELDTLLLTLGLFVVDRPFGAPLVVVTGVNICII
jgi:hypothetical protein